MSYSDFERIKTRMWFTLLDCGEKVRGDFRNLAHLEARRATVLKEIESTEKVLKENVKKEEDQLIDIGAMSAINLADLRFGLFVINSLIKKKYGELEEKLAEEIKVYENSVRDKN